MANTLGVLPQFNVATVSLKMAMPVGNICVVVLKYGKFKFFEGSAAKKMFKQIIPQEDVDILNTSDNLSCHISGNLSIKGTPANKGYAKGRVRIVLTTEDAKALKKGEILVARNTNPNFIEGMHKAAAFVTDEGGITSHAAIVSREMNKPCVTATKIATKVLKNRDIIEVDAEKGTVTRG